MTLYSQKRNWKYFLLFIVFLVVVFTFFYTNYIVNQISKDERIQVELWAKAIKKKAELVAYTQDLFEQLSIEEKKKVELWSQATQLAIQSKPGTDYSFLLKVISDNTTVPVILTKENNEIISSRNLDPVLSKNKAWVKEQIASMQEQNKRILIPVYGGERQYLYYKDSKLFEELKKVMGDLLQSFISEIVVNSARVPVVYKNETLDSVIATGHLSAKIKESRFLLDQQIEKMQSNNTPIRFTLDDDSVHAIYYFDSMLLRQLRYYPYIQTLLFLLFIALSYRLFTSFKKAEQNRVWAGMAKETAHQLGTPISSLMAWQEMIKKDISSEISQEIQKDIDRLKTVADRFSNIGSKPKIETIDLVALLHKTRKYFIPRIPKNVNFLLDVPNTEVLLGANRTLLEWAFENIIKNAIDSMQGKGILDIKIDTSQNNIISVDIQDTGKGIDPSKFKTVFEPGFTTKVRGWGLGLSLTKRIIEEILLGRVFVKSSKKDKGTCFRIELPILDE